jgi:transposase InsO family protein
MCKVLEVHRSGYYAWKQRPESARSRANAELLEKVREAFLFSRYTYGSQRIHKYWLQKGHNYSRFRVARLMRKAHLIPLKARRWHPQTTKQHYGDRIAPNILNQKFQATKPNEKWVGDITYIDTAEGWLYLASIMDLYSRKIVGWAMADRMNTQLVEKAWKMAVVNRHPQVDLLHHSDRGCQYTSEAYLKLLEAAKCQISMSRTGNCYDNAAMESFHATLKSECAYRQFSSRAEAKSTIFEYIEVWYNRQRLHSSLGYRSPADFEQISGH